MRPVSIPALVFASLLSGTVGAQSTFVEEGRLLEAVPETGSTLGSAVSISGSRIAFGDADPGRTGQVFTYVTQAGLRQPDATALALDGLPGDRFGNACALDGDTLVVGAVTADVNGFTDAGAAYVFVRSGATWVQQQKFTPSVPKAQGQFGFAVAVDGNCGATSSFNDQLGASVALAGNLVVGGAPNGDVAGGKTRGEAYVWRLDLSDVAVYCTAKVNSQGCLPAIGWSGVPSASAATPFLVTATQIINNKPGILVYGYLYAQLPLQGGTLCVSSPIRRTAVQSSGGNPQGYDCSGSYSFDFNALIQGGGDPTLVPGQWVFAQYWYRDPKSASTTGLTDALRFLIGA